MNEDGMVYLYQGRILCDACAKSEMEQLCIDVPKMAWWRDDPPGDPDAWPHPVDPMREAAETGRAARCAECDTVFSVD